MLSAIPPPIGQDLRLTIVSTDIEDSPKTPDAGANESANDTDETAHEKSLDSIREMYAALRACWTPPPKDEARRGVRDTYREAVDAALKRCTPLHFSKGMAGAVAGRPIAIRFVDERTVAKSIDKAKSMQ